LFADRGHLLSRLTFPSENRDRAGHTGRPWAATLANIDRYRKAFRLRVADCRSVSRADHARERQQRQPSNREGVARDRPLLGGNLRTVVGRAIWDTLSCPDPSVGVCRRPRWQGTHSRMIVRSGPAGVNGKHVRREVALHSDVTFRPVPRFEQCPEFENAYGGLRGQVSERSSSSAGGQPRYEPPPDSKSEQIDNPKHHCRNQNHRGRHQDERQVAG